MGKAYACLSGLVSDGALSRLPERYGFELYGCDSDVGLADRLQIILLLSPVPPPMHRENLDEPARYLLRHRQ